MAPDAGVLPSATAPNSGAVITKSLAGKVGAMMRARIPGTSSHPFEGGRWNGVPGRGAVGGGDKKAGNGAKQQPSGG